MPNSHQINCDYMRLYSPEREVTEFLCTQPHTEQCVYMYKRNNAAKIVQRKLEITNSCQSTSRNAQHDNNYFQQRTSNSYKNTFGVNVQLKTCIKHEPIKRGDTQMAGKQWDIWYVNSMQKMTFRWAGDIFQSGWQWWFPLYRYHGDRDEPIRP